MYFSLLNRNIAMKLLISQIIFKKFENFGLSSALDVHVERVNLNDVIKSEKLEQVVFWARIKHSRSSYFVQHIISFTNLSLLVPRRVLFVCLFFNETIRNSDESQSHLLYIWRTVLVQTSHVGLMNEYTHRYTEMHFLESELTLIELVSMLKLTYSSHNTGIEQKSITWKNTCLKS